MDAFEPMINLLVILTVLSIAAERITNLIKLRRDRKDGDTRDRLAAADTQREMRVGIESVYVGIIVAIAVKANFFELLANLEKPWATFGWVQVDGPRWIQSAATVDMGSILYTIGGCILTGIALGFGSKFWHDILSSVYEMKVSLRQKSRGN